MAPERKPQRQNRAGRGSTGPDGVAEIDAIIAGYIDRLNQGEKLDPEEVLLNHPRLADEILTQLEAFVRFGPDSRAGQRLGTLGDFTLRRMIGRGGMGVVYDAWQGSMERRVALKVLPVGISADQKAFVRFMREARATGKLSHPNVVSVHALGVHETTPFYAMEFVEGETLSQVLDRSRAKGGKKSAEERRKILTTITPLLDKARDRSSGAGFSRLGAAIDDEETAGLDASVVTGEPSVPGAGQTSVIPLDPIQEGNVDLIYCARLASAFAGVAEGLHHAHQRGVIHRDLKPSNLILDLDGRLRILDFGLAHLEGQESLTKSGDFMGTPLYMSPEQAMAKRIPIDHRTDLYSLGATLYEMLTFRPPFEGKDHRDTLSQIIFHDPEPPRRLNFRIAPDLETIVLKCLRKDPADRYATAEALAQDLRRYANGEPIEAKPEGTWEVFVRRVHRKRVQLIVGCMIVCLLGSTMWLGIARINERLSQNAAAYQNLVQRAVVRLEMGGPVQNATVGESVFSITPVPGEAAWPGRDQWFGASLRT